MKQCAVRIALGLAVLAAFLGHAGKFYRIPFVDQLDRIIYDMRLRLTMPRDVDPRIVILALDEKSLATPELGQWPWERDVIAGLVGKLFDKYGVAILGFDVVFAEPDRSSGLRVLDGLAMVIRQHRGTLDKYVGDQIMAFWGAPVGDAQHARQAVAAALAMRAELAQLNERFEARGWRAIEIGVGVNTGRCGSATWARSCARPTLSWAMR